MVGFFRNAFQQTGFTPTEDFKLQLLTNGGFDFGPGGARLAGDDAFPRLVQNLQDSFAKTAWQIVQEGRPFTEVLTTNRFVMTTALKSLYIQVEMPADAPFNNGSAMPAWKLDYSGNPIPIEQAISTMTSATRRPRPATATASSPNCRGGATVAAADFRGTSRIFQRLLGFTPQFPFSGSPTCGEQRVEALLHGRRCQRLGLGDDQPQGQRRPIGCRSIQPYDLPALRNAKELTLSLPRVGFYTTPAFLALWNTNDSNQHRVTVNQTLLAALGQSFTSDAVIMPISTAGLDAPHSVDGTECNGCHKSLDPMRQFWGNQLDYNDRNDFPAGNSFTGAAANPRPAAPGGGFAFGDVNDEGPDIAAVGACSPGSPTAAVFTASRSPSRRISASGPTRRPAARPDAEFRRVVGAFENSTPLQLRGADQGVLRVAAGDGRGRDRDLPDGGSVPVSISRRDHFCAALSNRLGKPDLCAQAVPVPNRRRRDGDIAQSVATDAFSRGSQIPVTPSDPTLFYRSASELLCSNIAAQVVDPTAGGGVYTMTDVPGAISDMVETLMGYPPGHPAHAEARQILQEHYDRRDASTSVGGGSRQDDQRDQRVAVDVHPGLRVTNRRRDRPLKENRQ